MIRVLVLTRYGHEAASSRQRFLQYKNYLKASGIDCTVQPFFWNDYLEYRFNAKTKKPAYGKLVISYAKRAHAIFSANRYDVILIQTEVFPYVPATVENYIFPQGIPRIYDYDDAWFHHYGGHKIYLIRKLMAGKISSLMQHATAVIVGSSYLYEYAAELQHNVFMLPTAIDLAQYPKREPINRCGEPFTVGWIGSPATEHYLYEIRDVLRLFCDKFDARLVVIGAGTRLQDMTAVKYIDWGETTEVLELSKIDVGIMPLTDDLFARGKCAFKLIQYMGCWKAVVASPVGENRRVIENGVSGFLASTEAEWFSALETLFRDRGLCRSMGQRGRRIVEDRYSTHVVGPQLRSVLCSHVRRGGG